jgi:hypothetical protein
MTNPEQEHAGDLADVLISKEVAIQDRMWGDANERADATGNQMIRAAQAQVTLTILKLDGDTSADALHIAEAFYPKDWEGFRDYGSNVANLVVAAAYLRSEVKRRILLGEDTTRAKRSEPYTKARPYVSSDVAAEGI